MKANIQNIQEIYSEIPKDFKVNGQINFNYNLKNEEDLFLDGWRNVVMPSYNKITQVLSSEFVLVDDIVTKHVVDLTSSELEQIQEENLLKIALFEAYPELASQNYQLLQLDNLPGIKRLEPLSDKGLKGVKKYTKNNLLIWSIETKFWFEEPVVFPEGVVKIIKIYDKAERVVDSWTKEVVLSADDKEEIRKVQRERILTYFKSQQSDLYNFLYMFFKSSIDDYIKTGDKEAFETILNDAAINHPYQDGNGNYIVRLTLLQEVPRQSGRTTTVLNGILEELV